MNEYWRVFSKAFMGNLDWLWKSITFHVPWYTNYFWGVMLISLAVWGLEIAFPWRKNQSVFRKDFWLDAFYIVFNFFIFSIAIAGFYSMAELFFSSRGLGMEDLALVSLDQWPSWLQLLVFFVVLDFLQWTTHVLLHRIPWMWRFHQIHHSVKEMGFAAHFRYHWMENILYKPLKTLGVMVLGGFEPEQAYMVHFVAIAIGHLNHANIRLTWGPLKYVFNNPVMHLYHHAYALPENHRYGMNFGISLSLWDYLFGTAHVPDAHGDTPLGFPGDEAIPSGFWRQLWYGFGSKGR